MADRKSGFYWVIQDNEKGWEVAEYFEDLDQWQLTGSEYNYYDGELEKIDETPVVRNENIYEPVKYDYLTSDKGCRLENPNLRDKDIILNDGVKDLTKPLWHEMNPLQRNYMDSTH